jgi:hypothetical protein
MNIGYDKYDKHTYVCAIMSKNNAVLEAAVLVFLLGVIYEVHVEMESRIAQSVWRLVTGWMTEGLDFEFR